MTTNYWLVKSEPVAFSWAQQVKNGVEPWTGVRNHAAKNNMKAMKSGDLAFFYHSNEGKEIVGIVRVAREAYPDPTADEGSGWVCVDLQTVVALPRPVTLATLKGDPRFKDLDLVRLSRLSVSKVDEAHWKALCAMGGI
jgi:predicted RNA-binding protein with PUA-like domain